MHRHIVSFDFHSPLGELMEQLIREKRACGYVYKIESGELHRFDRFLVGAGLTARELPRQLSDAWTANRPGERPATQMKRIGIIRGLALFLRRLGVDAHVPEIRMATAHRDFVPYIFSRDQIRQLIDAADRLPQSAKSPLRNRVMPEVLRLLCGCGLRMSEGLNLRVDDVDLGAGILTIFNAKFGKDRLVPVVPSIAERLRRYAADLGLRSCDAMFFPAPDGGPYSGSALYDTFRDLLRACGIPHGGRGRGPRVHDYADLRVMPTSAWKSWPGAVIAHSRSA